MHHNREGLAAVTFVIATVFMSPSFAAPDDDAGFTRLFDGRTLSGWTQVDRRGSGYVVEDGIIVCPEGGGGKLFTEKEYGNFAFRFEFRLTPGANNGVGIRAPIEGDAAYAGIEIQILDNEHPKYAALRPAQYHGSVYHIFPAKRGFLKPTGEWNSEEILADGRNIKCASVVCQQVSWRRCLRRATRRRRQGPAVPQAARSGDAGCARGGPGARR